MIRDPVLRALHKRLRDLPFGGRLSQHENALDALEVLAVRAGLRPAHLQGQGERSEAALRELAVIAADFGLTAHTTRPVGRYVVRVPDVPPEYWAWKQRHDTEEEDRAPPVLWVLSSTDLVPEVERAARGEIRVGGLLGYPPCCETHHRDVGLRMLEAIVRGYERQHGARTVEELIELDRRDVAVKFDAGLELEITVDESRERYPYVPFHACPACLRDEDSPAAKANARMREFAFSLDRAIGNGIARLAQEELARRRGQ